jgi:YfiH family protein
MQAEAQQIIIPSWPAPATVRAASTTRCGGVSLAPYDTFNLAAHVGDDPRAVATNRQRLRQCLALPGEPHWLEQVHGTGVIRLDADTPLIPRADASVAYEPGQVCAVLTADCLPVLFCDRAGSRVAAAHAGWRGLAHGVLEASLAAMDCEAADILVWLGPAIGPQAFEVGEEVREQFMAHDEEAAQAFVPSHLQADGKHWLADLYLLARQRLRHAGVDAIYGGGECTYGDAARFFSYRREASTGRMASLIWLQQAQG